MVKPSPKKMSPSERPQYSVNDTNGRFKGVRMRKWGKWVAEVRLPNSRERIWLGSYESPEKAARAYDAAVFCLRGPNAKFNFPATPPEIPSATNLTPAQIQAVATRFAHELPLHLPSPPPTLMSSSSSSSRTECPADGGSKGQEEDKWPLLDEMLLETGNGNPEYGVFGSAFDSFPAASFFPAGEGGDEVEDDSGAGGAFCESPRLWSF